MKKIVYKGRVYVEAAAEAIKKRKVYQYENMDHTYNTFLVNSDTLEGAAKEIAKEIDLEVGTVSGKTDKCISYRWGERDYEYALSFDKEALKKYVKSGDLGPSLREEDRERDR